MEEFPSLFKRNDFLKLWTAQTISVFGSQFSGLAIPYAAKTILNAAPIQFGILAALATAAFLIFGLPVGVWVDRHRRRKIMILSDVGRGALLSTIPLAAILGRLSIDLFYFVGFFVGVLTVFFDISYQSYLPSLVERSQLVDANSKLETSRAVAQTAGPSLSGIAIQVISAPMAIVGDTVGYLGSALSLSRIKIQEAVMISSKRPAWHDVKEGLSVVFKDARLRSIAFTTATFNLFSSAMFAIIVPFFVGNLSLSAFRIGLVFSFGAVGGIIGGLVSRRLSGRLGVGWAIIISGFISGGFLLGVLFATPNTALLVLSLAFFGSSIGVVVYNVNQVSFRQALVPIELQGRMNATMRTIVWGTLPIGGLMGGILGQFLGLPAAITIAVAGNTLAPLWALFSPVRKIREIPMIPETVQS